MDEIEENVKKEKEEERCEKEGLCVRDGECDRGMPI